MLCQLQLGAEPSISILFSLPLCACRCGCPWWSSEDWDARCLRCGWDCESSGYDNDSQPLAKHRPKWELYTAAIREGRTPAWKGSSSSSGGGGSKAAAAGVGAGAAKR